VIADGRSRWKPTLSVEQSVTVRPPTHIAPAVLRDIDPSVTADASTSARRRSGRSPAVSEQPLPGPRR
jgi:hypothetical protein